MCHVHFCAPCWLYDDGSTNAAGFSLQSRCPFFSSLFPTFPLTHLLWKICLAPEWVKENCIQRLANIMNMAKIQITRFCPTHEFVCFSLSHFFFTSISLYSFIHLSTNLPIYLSSCVSPFRLLNSTEILSLLLPFCPYLSLSFTLYITQWFRIS